MVDQTKEAWCSLGKESTEDIYPENLEGCVQSVATFVFWKGAERSVQFGMCCFVYASKWKCLACSLMDATRGLASWQCHGAWSADRR